MKKILKLSILLLALLLPATAAAHDFEVDGIYYNINGNEAEVTYRGEVSDQYDNEYSGSVTIPETVTHNGTTYSVTTIDNDAFSNCSGLTSVTIPNSVTTIGGEAFEGCSGLTSIDIPNSVTEIGNLAFIYCSNLTSITVAEDNPEYDSRDNCNAIIETETNTLIAGCQNSSIPNSVTEIGYSAFYGCTGLTSIDIPNSVTTIGGYAFEGTAWYDNQPDGVVYAGLVAYQFKGTMPANTHITLREGTLGIAISAFNNSNGLTSVTIPNSVTTIGNNAFSGCSGLTSVNIGNSVTEIGYLAFRGCSGLTSVTIPNSVTTIGNGAFSDCSGLTSITIPNSVTTIDHYAFSGCSELTGISIPNSVTTIGGYVFDGTAWFDNQPDGLVYAGLVAYKYKGDMPANTHITLREGTLGIAGEAFSDCSGLTSVTIPNSVIEIGELAFFDCDGLDDVYCYISDPSLVTMDSRAFYLFISQDYSARTLHVPVGSLEAYQADTNWSQYFGSIVEMSILATSVSLNNTATASSAKNR